MTRNIIIGVVIVAVIILVVLLYPAENLTPLEAALKVRGSSGKCYTKNAPGNDCKIDEDCGPDNFCYMGKCWGYWKGFNMPWSTCRNPYCQSTDPGITCSIDASKCLPYCKCVPTPQAGGSMKSECMPTCGAPCTVNDDCPAGCPMCSHGICSAPTPGGVVW